MERIFSHVVFVAGCLLSSVTFATVEETPPTIGTPISYEPLSFGDWNYMVHGVLPGGAASQVAGSEYSNYRADLAKKKYCKDSGYPANVPFCAKYKAEETQNCQVTARATRTQCQIDYNRVHKNELISCGKVFFSDNLLSQCNKAADSQLVGDLLSCELSFDTTVSRC